MKIAIIAGNRSLPILLARGIRELERNKQIICFCFKGETSRRILDYADKVYWLMPGQLGKLRRAIHDEGVGQAVFAGQISPWRIFYPRFWDEELTALIKTTKDFRPHAIFSAIIKTIENDGVRFIDSTLYLKEAMATRGVMNAVEPSSAVAGDIDYGSAVIKRFVELDIGQTIAVKNSAVVAAETLEGTDRTIKRAGQLSGQGVVVLKFSKANQDMRFDVPVVGTTTLKVMRRVGAKALALEEGRVIILEKEKFFTLADHYGISVMGIPNG